VNTVTLTDYRTVENALCNTNLKQALYDEGGVLMDKVLVTLHGAEHRERRTLEMKLFRRNYFRYYEEEVIPEILEQCMRWRLDEGRADVVDFGYDAMSSLTVAFAGLDRQEHTIEESKTLTRLIRSLGKAATLGQSKLDREQIRAEIRETLDEFKERLFDPSYARRKAFVDRFNKGELAEEDLPRDVLTVLIRNEDRINLTLDLLVRETAFFFLAGAHTSVHSLGHAIHHLLAWIEDHPQDEDRLISDPLYLQRFVHESLRLHPSSPIAKRRALAPVSFTDGQQAAEGDIVVLDLNTANRSKEIFGEDAGAFNPHRSWPARTAPFGLTFGAGMHACLARNLAAGTILKYGKAPDPEDHQIGTVATIAGALLKHGVRRDPEQPGRLDTTITRDTWESYPVVFGAAGA